MQDPTLDTRFGARFDAPVRDALGRGDSAHALAAARDAVAAHPADPRAHRLLATAQRAAGDRAAALASIDRAIALRPDDADAHFERAGLLLGDRQLDEAQAALARSVGLDPNLFGAYLLQAQLALGRGELDEADRLRRLAERVAPDHPQLAAIEGMLALRRGDATLAQAILSAALQRTPDDPQIGYALGFAYMELGHHAFAEQVFRNVLARNPHASNLHALIADLLLQQGRPTEALAEIAPLLAEADAPPGLRRIAGELELAAGSAERALPWLRDALAAQPQDQRTLLALMEVWRRTGAAVEARATLDAVLAQVPQATDLWRARLAWEPVGADSARGVVARWRQSDPDALPALEAQMVLDDMAGDAAAAEAIAQRIVTLEPGRSSGELRLLQGLLQRDPAAGVQHAEALLARAPSEQSRRLLRGWLAVAQDGAGQTAAAADNWARLHAESLPQRLAPWQPSAPRADWATLYPPVTGPGVPGTPGVPAAAAVGFLWGFPGSAVERVAAVLANGLPAFRADRFGPTPPPDGFQRFDAITELDSGRLDPAVLVADWRAGLPARGAADGQIIEWLPYWDNALLLGLRAQLPDALLLVALRDPRDMLLDWLAFGTSLPPLAMASPLAAAQWLAQLLEQVATLHEQDLFPHQLLRLDAVLDDPQALADAVGAAIQTPLPTPPADALGPPRFPAGHWRAYADALAEPFAVLTPGARRLGYD